MPTMEITKALIQVLGKVTYKLKSVKIMALLDIYNREILIIHKITKNYPKPTKNWISLFATPVFFVHTKWSSFNRSSNNL